MRVAGYLAGTLTLVAALGGGAASAANICRTDTMTCATNMPIEGYCECTARGATQSGTVAANVAPHGKVNAAAGGCGTDPNAPACR
jgi:hypothetical protein